MSKQVPSLQAPNPFEPIKIKKNQPRTIKYCAWEVLKTKPEGLVLGDLVKEIEDQGLRHFSGKKSPAQLVSGELAKQKEYFTHDKEKNLWHINADKLVDSEETEDDELIMALYNKSPDKKAITIEDEKKEIAPLKAEKQHKDDIKKSGDLEGESKEEGPKNEEKRELEEAGKGRGEDESSKAILKAKASLSPSPLPSSSSHSHSPSPPSRKRTLECSPSPRSKKRAKGIALVGLLVKVWWAGENQCFPGQISAYNQTTDRYEIEYEDGDIDKDLEIRKHEVEMTGSEIDCIRIDAHNMDDSDNTDGEEESGDGDKEGDEGEVEEKEEKQPSKEAE